jgi:HEAT repeat protein
MVFGLFRSKKDKAIQRALDSTKDNVTRIKALDTLEEEAKAGDAESLLTLLRCFQITVKPDKQEQTLTPYDDEQEKWALIDRLVAMEGRRLETLNSLRKELATPPSLLPGRRDGIVWLIELLKAMAAATTDDEEQAGEMVRDELVRALASFDPEETYREPARKIELIRALGRSPSDVACDALIPFLRDVDESVRFRALESVATAGGDKVADALCDVLLDDESKRLRERAAEVLADLECSIKGHARRKEIEGLLPGAVLVDKKGVVRRRGAS